MIKGRAVPRKWDLFYYGWAWGAIAWYWTDERGVIHGPHREERTAKAARFRRAKALNLVPDSSSAAALFDQVAPARRPARDDEVTAPQPAKSRRASRGRRDPEPAATLATRRVGKRGVEC
jgi:hypothetical protein